MAEQKKSYIKIMENGPYIVTGDIPLNQATITCNQEGDAEQWTDGRFYDTPKESYALCRCGHSKGKPFCDGTHTAEGFVAKERANRPAYADLAEVHEGPALDLMDEESLCAGARFCDRGPTAWRLVYATDEPEAKALFLEETTLCPSGRLTARTKEGTEIEPQLPQEISLVEDPQQSCRGPLWIKGGIEVQDADNKPYETRNRVTLCRCGESKNKPYCDAAHFNCPHMAGLDE